MKVGSRCEEAPQLLTLGSQGQGWGLVNCTLCAPASAPLAAGARDTVLAHNACRELSESCGCVCVSLCVWGGGCRFAVILCHFLLSAWTGQVLPEGQQVSVQSRRAAC